MAENNVKALVEEGQSVWLDDISRQLLQSGEFARQIEEVGIRGVTSNPTIFEKAIAAGTAYDEQVADLLRANKSAGEIFEAVAVEDIRRRLRSLPPALRLHQRRRRLRLDRGLAGVRPRSGEHARPRPVGSGRRSTGPI